MLIQNFWMDFHNFLVHLSFVQCEQVNFRPKKKVKIKVSHSGGGGRGGGGGGGGERSKGRQA